MRTVLGIDPTRIDSTALYPVGTEAQDPRGGAYEGNTIVYCRAEATITAGQALMIATADATNEEPWALKPATQYSPVRAIAHVSITDEYYGWVTKRGSIQVTTNAAVSTAGVILVPDDSTAGEVITVSLDSTAFAGATILELRGIAASSAKIQAMDSQSAAGLLDVYIG